MNRLAVAVAGIAVFTAAAVGGVWLLTRPGAPAGVPDAATAPELVQAPRLSPEDFQRPQTPPLPAPPSPPQIYGPPRVEPPRGSWEAVPVVARPSGLGRAGGAIGRGLNELQPRLAACFDEVTAARFGPRPRSVALDPSLPDAGTPVLVLQLETVAGEARIVDAPVDTQGGVEDGVVSCAQGVLRGQRFEDPQIPAGQRYRLLLSLSQ